MSAATLGVRSTARVLRRGARAGYSLAAERLMRAAGIAPPSSLLILGHMRSGSSLLLHLLLTHPAVAAMGERNATYVGRQDIRWHHVQVRQESGRWFAPIRYVADQVNHNHLTPSRALLLEPRVRTIFMLRHPAAAVGQPALALQDLLRQFVE